MSRQFLENILTNLCTSGGSTSSSNDNPFVSDFLNAENVHPKLHNITLLPTSFHTSTSSSSNSIKSNTAFLFPSVKRTIASQSSFLSVISASNRPRNQRINTSFSPFKKVFSKISKMISNLLKDPIPKQYRMVTLYPQSHHPALATQPLIIESRDADPLNAYDQDRIDTAKEDVSPIGEGAVETPTESLKKAMEMQDTKAFSNPYDERTFVLYPIAQDW